MSRIPSRYSCHGRRRLASFRPAVDVLESRVLLSGITFEDVTAEAGIVANRGFGFSTAWVDFNMDGLTDLWIGRHGPNQRSNLGQPMPNPLLYKNVGDGTFVDVFDTVFPPLPPSDNHGSAWADVDNDGDPDFLQTVGGGLGLTVGTQTNQFYLNDNGVLVDATRTAGLGMPIARGREAEWIDANRDGLLDVFLSNEIRFDRLSPSKLLLQTGGGWDNAHPLFSDVGAAAGVALAAVQDLNGDRVPDIASVSVSDDTIHFLLATEAGPGFVEGSALLEGITFDGNVKDFAFADFNGDLYTDMVVTLDGSRDVLLLFDPVEGKFVDHSVEAGMQSNQGSQVVAADFDNDGDVDIYVGCESATADLPDVIYQNRGDGTFVTLTGNLHTGASQIDWIHGVRVIAADFNNDGFVDLFQNGTGLPETPNQLLRNTGNTNHWLQLDLSGVRSNRDAIGARVEVTAGGVTQFRYQTSGKHHFAQNDSRLHFGLSAQSLIETVTVYWPSGEVTILENVAADQILAVSESAANTVSRARPIVVESGAGDFHGSLSVSAPQQFFVFDVTADAALHVDLTGADLAVELLDSAGSSVLATGQTSGGFVSIEHPLTVGRYLLRVSLVNRAAPSDFTVSPRLIPAVDVQGPVVEDIALDETLGVNEFAIVAVVSDAIHGGSALMAAEFFIDSVGAVGTGHPMLPSSGRWGVLGNLAHGFIPAAVWDSLSPGTHTVFVRGQDVAGNWGELAWLDIEKGISNAPSLDLVTTAIGLTSGVPAELLFPAVNLSDDDSPVSAGATMTMLLGQAISGYKLSLAVDSRLRVLARFINFDGVPVAELWRDLSRLRIRFNEYATPFIMQEVLKRVRLELTGDSPPTASQHTLQVVVSDGSGGRAGAVTTVNVSVSEISLNSEKLTYIENASPQRIAPNAGISDPDPSGYIGGALTVSFASGAAFASGSTPQDRLGIENAGSASGEIGLVGDTVTYAGIPIGTAVGGQSGVPLAIVFNDAVTRDAVVQLIRSITFETLSENPSTRIRNVAFVLQHANGTTGSPAYAAVKVEAVNDAPVVSMGSSQQRYVENAPPVLLAPGAVVTDVDSLNFNGGSLTVSLASGGHVNDQLRIQHQGTGAGQIGIDGTNVTYGGVFLGTLSGGTNLTPLQIMLAGTASITGVRQVIRNVTFETPGDNPRAGVRKVSFVLNDGDGGTSAAAFKWAKVEAVNDAPVVSIGSSQQRYVENAPPVLLAPGAVVTDVDSLNFNGGSLTASLASGGHVNDQLRIQHQGTGAGQIGIDGTNVTYGGVFVGTFSGGTNLTPLQIMLTGTASVTGVRQLIRYIAFQTVGDNPRVGLREVSFVLNDGDGGTSATAFKSVRVEAVNDAPVVSMGISQQHYIRNAAPVVIAADAVVTDVDSPNFAGGSLAVSLISGGDANDQLAIRNRGTGAGQIGINGTSVTYGGVVIGNFTGGTQLTPLQIMLTADANAFRVRQLIRNVTFQTTGDMAPAGVRKVSFVLNDGDGGMSAMAFREVRVELPGGSSAASRAVTSNGSRAIFAPVTPSSRIADVLFFDPDRDRSGLFGAL